MKKVGEKGSGGGGGAPTPQKAAPKASTADPHSAMLDAIKGGARQQLQKSRDRLPSVKPVQAREEEGDDMMSALKKQLNRRRSTVLGKQMDRPARKFTAVEEGEEEGEEGDKILGLKDWIEFQESSDESDTDDSDSWDD